MNTDSSTEQIKFKYTIDGNSVYMMASMAAILISLFGMLF